MPYLETGQNFSDGGSMILANYLKKKINFAVLLFKNFQMKNRGDMYTVVLLHFDK